MSLTGLPVLFPLLKISWNKNGEAKKEEESKRNEGGRTAWQKRMNEITEITTPSSENKEVGEKEEATSVSDEQWKESIFADATNLASRGQPILSEAGIEIEITPQEALRMLKKRKIEGTCEVCKETDAKYCCPRCNTRSCSLGCCKKHKTDNNCNGERNKTAYIPITEFTDGNLISGMHPLSSFNINC